MREFAKLSPRFWIGETGKRIRELGRDAQVVALYLCSSPSSNFIGLYYVPLSTISHEVGLSQEEVQKALEGLEEVGFAKYDPVSEFVWVVTMARYQIGVALSEKDTRIKAVTKEWLAAARTPFHRDFHTLYGVAFRLPAVEGEGDPPGRPFGRRPVEDRSGTGRGPVGDGSPTDRAMRSTPSEMEIEMEKEREIKMEQEGESEGEGLRKVRGKVITSGPSSISEEARKVMERLGKRISH